MLPALATTAEATAFGVSTTSAALLRASTRVRGFVGQQISSGTSTVVVRGPVVRLHERPVVSVAGVADDEGVTVAAAANPRAAGWWLSGDFLHLPSDAEYTVTYEHGYEVIPDEVVEIVATVAGRLGSTDSTVAAGVVQEQSGSVSQTFGWDAWKGVSGLTSEEKSVLRRLFPVAPRTLVMRA